MNEFSIIDDFFKTPALHRDDVVFGIGDDAACLNVPSGHHLLVSTDTLVAGVHFLSEWDARDIAWRAVMVNVSDMAAMAVQPCWVSLALTLPEANPDWLARFSQGLHAALQQYNIALIGGDTTRGPLSITLTIHGTAPEHTAIRRNGARVGDIVWVSGPLGAAALAVSFLSDDGVAAGDRAQAMACLLRPRPRLDLLPLLRRHASAALDISDGLSADLNHICESSGPGACLSLSAIPVHPLVTQYRPDKALDFALSGGDDYELCFTTPPDRRDAVLAESQALGAVCYPIGVMTEQGGLHSELGVMSPRGYTHFQQGAQ